MAQPPCSSAGCGRPAAPGLDGRGRPFRTCCRGCALGGEHDPRCDAELAEALEARGGAPAPAPAAGAPAAGPAPKLCRMGCGLPAAPGRDWRGRPLETCCKDCALGKGRHGRYCGLEVEPRYARYRKRIARLAPLWDPIWGQVELRRLTHGESASMRRRCGVLSFGCCPCLVVTCGCLEGEVWSGLSKAEVRMAWRRLLFSWSMALSLVQVLTMVALLVIDGGHADFEENPMLGPTVHVLDRLGAKNAARMLYWHEWWRLFTPMLLHAGWLHLLGNLALQLRTGLVLEVLWGHTAWLVIYLMSGTFATLTSCVLKPGQLSVGSSGALCGLLGAWGPFILMTWNQTLPKDRVARNAQLVVAVTSAVLMVPLSFVPMVDYAAHLGGLVFGAALSLVVFAGRLQSRSWRLSTRAAGLLGIAALVSLGSWWMLHLEPTEALLHVCGPEGC